MFFFEIGPFKYHKGGVKFEVMLPDSNIYFINLDLFSIRFKKV